MSEMKDTSEKFILTSVSKILDDAIAATNALQEGIECYPVQEYVLQAVFIRMTGFMEQKMKCICWELASSDYSYRYERFLRGGWDLGECSSYSDKAEVYKDLWKVTVGKMEEKKRKQWISANGNDIVRSAKSLITNALDTSDFGLGISHERKDFLFVIDGIEEKCIFAGNEPFCSCANCGDKATCKARYFLPSDCSGNNKSALLKIYQKSFHTRNRIAHNLSSYQTNFPKMSLMANVDNVYDSYHFRYYINLLLDNIFRALFSCYLESRRREE